MSVDISEIEAEERAKKDIEKEIIALLKLYRDKALTPEEISEHKYMHFPEYFQRFDNHEKSKYIREALGRLVENGDVKEMRWKGQAVFGINREKYPIERMKFPGISR